MTKAINARKYARSTAASMLREMRSQTRSMLSPTAGLVNHVLHDNAIGHTKYPGKSL